MEISNSIPVDAVFMIRWWSTDKLARRQKIMVTGLCRFCWISHVCTLLCIKQHWHVMPNFPRNAPFFKLLDTIALWFLFPSTRALIIIIGYRSLGKLQLKIRYTTSHIVWGMCENWDSYEQTRHVIQVPMIKSTRIFSAINKSTSEAAMSIYEIIVFTLFR